MGSRLAWTLVPCEMGRAYFRSTTCGAAENDQKGLDQVCEIAVALLQQCHRRREAEKRQHR
jgi:hypothetical protein